MPDPALYYMLVGAGGATLCFGVGYILSNTRMSNPHAAGEDFIGFREDIPRRSGVRSPDRSAGIRVSSHRNKRSGELTT